MTDVTDLLEVTTAQDIRDLIDEIKQELGTDVTWRDVGGRENNLATINMGTDPAGALTERITNAIDAVIDHEWYRQGQPTNVSSPREAVESWFGIPNGKLSNVENLRDDAITEIRDRVKVTLRDSGKDARPTIDIRDRGIGLQAEDFSNTILSLNRSRKMKKFHLAGAFGQGGSTALAYSDNYTLIISRAAPVDGDDHPVAFTVVRFNEGDYDIDKHGTYEFMVNPRTGQPFTINEVSTRDFPHGTLVRHVAMEVGKFNSTMTSPTSGLYYLGHHYLFDPLLPFLVEEQRSNKTSRRRTVAGNNRRISTSKILEYKRSAEQKFRDGTVTLNWWVLSADADGSKKPRNRIKNYTLASKPIVVTYNGQKQGEFPNSVIKKDLQLPYLERYIVVHVDCDEVDNRTRRELFPTTRESLRDASVADDLQDLIVETLREDENLRRLDRERKKRYLQRTDSDSVDRIRKRLADRIQDRLKSDGVGSGSGSGSSGSSRDSEPGPKPEPIPVEEPPTFIQITSREPRTVHPGKRFTLSFKTDAKPAYFGDSSSFVPIIRPLGAVEYAGTTSVYEGHGQAHFRVDKSAEVGSEGEITLEVRPRRSGSLSDAITFEVAEEDEGTGDNSGRAQTPNVSPQWVQKGDEFWEDEGWDETSVAKVVRDDESTNVFISADNQNLNRLIERAQRRRSGTVNEIKNFYMEHVAYHAVVAHLDLEENGDIDAEGEGKVDVSLLEKEQEQEMKRLSKTVCGIMEDMFDVIAQREYESDANKRPEPAKQSAAQNGEDG